MRFLWHLRNGLGYVKRAVGYRSLHTASLIQRNLPNVAAPLRPDEGRIVCDSLGLSLDPKRHGYYLQRMVAVRDLVKQAGGTFVLNETGDPEFHLGDIRIAPEVFDDLLVLEEVFVQRLYDFYPNRDCFVWDVGMNVGIASLFYASIKGWEVLAFEPFPETFAIANKNIVRNRLEGRIHTRNAGVAAETTMLEVDFHGASRATNGLFGNLDKDRKGPDQRILINLIDAAEALQEAIGMAGGRPILAKIDCEGAEYDIVERLVEKELLTQVAAYIVEYHLIRPEHNGQRLIDDFQRHGFVVQHLWTNEVAGGLFAIQATV